MASDLRVHLLGDFRIVRGDEGVVTLGSPRLQALLAHLILHRSSPRTRRHLAFLFWPDSSEAQAHTNLRQLLHRLRRALPDLDPSLQIGPRTIGWQLSDGITIDIVDLEAAWTAMEGASAEGRISSAISAAEEAVSLYIDHLLPDCYEKWIEEHRERFRRRTVMGMERLVGWLEERQEWRAALVHGQRLLELDPLREEAHRAVIRLHARSGDVALALRAYDTCAEVLDREVGAEPSKETRDLVQSIRRGNGPGSRTGGAASGAASHTTPLVGRHDEWRRLRSSWRTARGGRSGVALILGEAGIGKTRLADSFLEWLRGEGAAAAHARCWAVEGRLPFAPVADWLRSAPLLEGARTLPSVWRREVARILPELGTEEGTPSSVEAAEGRLRLFEGLARVVDALDRPLLLVLDDAHRCDADTLEWLHYLLRVRSEAPLLVVATIRSGEPAADARFDPWLRELRLMESLVEVPLGPLDAEETAALGSAVTNRALGGEEAEALFAETEGNPLFVVEVVRRRLGARQSADEAQGSAGPASDAGLPERVREVIRGRLRLLSSEGAELLALLATVGRDTSFGLIRAAKPGDTSGVVPALEELARRHLIRESGDGRYGFTHDKIREVAYGELSSARRQLLHEGVAEALAASHSQASEQVAGEIAHHLERAGRREAAISWYRKAADHALALYANQEAIEHLQRAIALLGKQPPSPRRTEREIELQTALGVPLVLTGHYAGARVWRAYSRARDLSRRVQKPVGAPVLRALALLSLTRSRLPEVVRLADELMEAAREDADPMMQVEAHYVTGVALYWQGRIPEARRQLSKALELYRPERLREHLHMFTQDPGAVCGVRLALAEWHIGEEKEARRRCLDTIERAEGLGHPFSLGYARAFGTWVLLESGDLDSARRQVVALRRESDPGLRIWGVMAEIVEGFLVAEAGNPSGGLERILEACSSYTASGNHLGFPYHQGLLAKTYRLAGRPDEAMAAVTKGLKQAKATGERFWDSELHRLRGELGRDLGAPAAETDAAFSRARQVALGQGALALARRVAPGRPHRHIRKPPVSKWK